MQRLRPVDEDLIVKAAMKTKRIATVQDHYKNGVERCRLEGDCQTSVAGGVSLHCPERLRESGNPKDLYEKYGLSASKIMEQLGLTLRS